MTKIQRILVAIDKTPHSKAALEYALFLKDQFKAKLDLIHVCDPSEVRGTDEVAVLTRAVPGSTLESYNEAEIQRELTEFVKTAGLDRQVRNDEIEQAEDVVEMIVQIAAKKRADVIVLGSNEKGRIERLIRGSVVHELVEKSPCPVIVCRQQG